MFFSGFFSPSPTGDASKRCSSPRLVFFLFRLCLSSFVSLKPAALACFLFRVLVLFVFYDTCCVSPARFFFFCVRFLLSLKPAACDPHDIFVCLRVRPYFFVFDKTCYCICFHSLARARAALGVLRAKPGAGPFHEPVRRTHGVAHTSLDTAAHSAAATATAGGRCRQRHRQRWQWRGGVDGDGWHQPQSRPPRGRHRSAVRSSRTDAH